MCKLLANILPAHRGEVVSAAGEGRSCQFAPAAYSRSVRMALLSRFFTLAFKSALGNAQWVGALCQIYR